MAESGERVRLRVLRAEQFVFRPYTPGGAGAAKKRPATEPIEDVDMAESHSYPKYKRSMSRITDTWKKTLTRKVSLRRSNRVKRLARRSNVTANYAAPFECSSQFFQFIDMANGLDKDMNVLYYMQIALNLQEHELYKKIDHEMKMRDGSAKMLAAAKYTPQQLEAAKSLHTSNCRMAAYMEYLQARNCDRSDICEPSKSLNPEKSTATLNRQTAGNKPLLPESSKAACRAKVSISEIRVPLMWKDTDHFKNKGNYRRFTVFCMVRIGTDVYETSLVSEVDRLYTDISFEDVITLENVPHDFEAQLKIFAYEHHEDLTIASTQVKLKKRISDISNTVGKRLSSLTVKESFDMQSLPGPKFHVVAESTLRLRDASERTGSFDLVTKDQEGAPSLPLFGNFSCRFVVQPDCLMRETISGFLYVKEDKEWIKYWCSLQNLKISCWNSQFEADMQDPLTMIPVTKESIIGDMDPSHADKPNSVYIKNRVHDEEWQLAALTADSLADWWSALEQHLLDQVVWKQACETVMCIQTSKAPETPYFQRERRAGSLYDKTRVKRDQKHQLLDQTGQEDSPLTLAFKRYTKDSRDGRSSPLSRNNSCPK